MWCKVRFMDSCKIKERVKKWSNNYYIDFARILVLNTFFVFLDLKGMKWKAFKWVCITHMIHAYDKILCISIRFTSFIVCYLDIFFPKSLFDIFSWFPFAAYPCSCTLWHRRNMCKQNPTVPVPHRSHPVHSCSHQDKNRSYQCLPTTCWTGMYFENCRLFTVMGRRVKVIISK